MFYVNGKYTIILVSPSLANLLLKDVNSLLGLKKVIVCQYLCLEQGLILENYFTLKGRPHRKKCVGTHGSILHWCD